jgi:hypothetical protein
MGPQVIIIIIITAWRGGHCLIALGSFPVSSCSLHLNMRTITHTQHSWNDRSGLLCRRRWAAPCALPALARQPPGARPS